ncbi:MAG: hypothetical protein FWD97_06270 [Defluviitaleaceae bacterium]|nr:hypothetical protein [Defluviitaleaceae bacterium]
MRKKLIALVTLIAVFVFSISLNVIADEDGAIPLAVPTSIVITFPTPE